MFNRKTGETIAWGNVIDFTIQNGSHFFSEKTMERFESHVHLHPRVGPDGHVYALISSMYSKGIPEYETRKYDVVRIVNKPEHDNYGRVHRSYPEDDPYAGDQVHKYNTKREARLAFDDIIEGRDDPSQYRWY